MSESSKTNISAPEEPRKRLGGILDGIEWLGNKLPDPAFLFLIGAVLVLVASSVFAPSLPDGWRVRWNSVGNVLGGVDQQLSEIVREIPGSVDDKGNPKYERATFEVVESDGEEAAAYLVVEGSGAYVRDEHGEPIDFSKRGWAVFGKNVVTQTDPDTGEEVRVLENNGTVTFATNLLTSEGLFWCLKSMEHNFIGFAPLGVVLLGMLGIGVSEKTGLIAALIKVFMRNVPNHLLTPSMVFIGIMSSLATDAGYIVLPPLAAAIYLAAGRSPLAGIAACFAGVAAGFNANLIITGLEPMMANLTQSAAQIADPERMVSATSNWYFLASSTILISFVGWGVTAVFVEKRLAKKSAEEGGPDPLAAEHAKDSLDTLTPTETKGLVYAMVALAGLLGLIVTLNFWKGSPLYGNDGAFPRWVSVVVPLMFMCFVVPGLIYGSIVGNVRSSKDAAKQMIDSMAMMAPIIVLAFFAGQFVSYFGETHLGTMLAFRGGEWLFEQGLPHSLLLIAFIGVVMVFNLFVGSMSAKYALFAPIFVPMFMLSGIRPELTQVAYRVGDSVTNVITPLNPYLVIVLVFMQRYAPRAGMGTLIAMMLPYTIVFAIVWTIFLLLWDVTGLPLGVGDPLTSMPAALP